MASAISAKGRITVPMANRMMLNWKTGDGLGFAAYERIAFNWSSGKRLSEP